MKSLSLLRSLLGMMLLLMLTSVYADESRSDVKDPQKLLYLVSDIRIPFWAIMGRGVKRSAESLGYQVEIHSSSNATKQELEGVAKAIREKVAGIVISPTTSSACVTVLKLAKKAGIPVVIADIGTDEGDYVSYISSDNDEGAYKIGQVLVEEMRSRGFEQGRVGIIAIPQRRLNGQARTAGFMRALGEAGIKSADLKQQVTFSDDETYRFSREMIAKYPDLRALWLQGSDRYDAALRAIADSGKVNEILLVSFDAEPEFIKLIPQGILVGAAMQQPYLMGEEAVRVLDDHLKGLPVTKELKLPVLAISARNIRQRLPLIKRNVLGIEAAD